MTQLAIEEKIKKPFNYRGSAIAIKDIRENFVPVQTLEQLPNNSNIKLPRLIIISDIQKHGYGSGKVYVTYMTYKDNFRQYNVFIPEDFKVKVLSGKMGQIMLDKYAEYKSSKIENYLGNICNAVGSTPEIFVEKDADEFIPAFNFLGSKENPNYSKAHAYGHQRVYHNGLQAKFQTSAQSCLAWQVDSVQMSLAEVLRAAKAKYPGAKPSVITAAKFSTEHLKEINNTQVKHLNVYGLTPKKILSQDDTVRFANGPMHFGFNRVGKVQLAEIIKTLDAILGVSCVSLFASFDNPARREYCGIAGDYLLPTHGLEYNVLSNAWLFHPFIMNTVFDLARKCISLGYNNLRTAWKTSEQETIDVINTSNVSQARTIIERNRGVFLKLFQSCYGSLSDYEELYLMFMNGMESAIKDPLNIVKNWRLDGGWVSHSDGQHCNYRHSYMTLKNGEKLY